MLRNKKNWLLGFALLLFFPIFIYYTNQTPPETLREVKRAEQSKIQDTLEMYGNELMNGSAEQQAVYENLTRQSSLVNFQVFYIRAGEVTEEYIDNGLELTTLRKELRDAQEQSIAEHLILSEEEIMKDDVMLQFLKQKIDTIDLDSNLFLKDNQFVLALTVLSGLPFVFYLLIVGSDMLVFEQRHRTIFEGFPISFMKKLNVKVLLHFLQSLFFLLLGIGAGLYMIIKMVGRKTLNSPVIVYKNGKYEGVVLSEYIVMSVASMVLVILLVLYLSLLLNIVFENAYANVVVGIALFLLPFLLQAIMGTASLLTPLRYVDFARVLSGDLAKELGKSTLGLMTSNLWVVVFTTVLVVILYMKNKLSFRGVQSSEEVHYEK